MQNSSSNLRFAGDVSLKKIQLTSLNGQTANIVNQVISIEIYEDMFSPFISLAIVIKESNDFINLFPFAGEEYLEIEIDTPTMNKPIKGLFYVYKITDRIYSSEREVMYTIKAASIEFLNDANLKLNEVYSGNVSEVATKLIGKNGLNTNKNIIVDKTSNTTKFISNYWSPIKCINYAATSAISESGSPSFLFYENRDGFNFRCINDLLKNESYQKFVKDNYARTENSSADLSTTMNPNEDYKRIIEIQIPVVTDYMRSIQSGQIKSRLITHDILTKKYKVKDYSVKTDTKPSNLLNPNPSYSKYAIANSASSLSVQPKHYGLYTNFIDVSNTKILQKRASFFENIEKFKINISVIGRTDYTIGKIVELNIPKVTQITQEDKDYLDKSLSGRYLVSAISHRIDRERHTCNMELIKNSTLLNLSKQ